MRPAVEPVITDSRAFLAVAAVSALLAACTASSGSGGGRARTGAPTARPAPSPSDKAQRPITKVLTFVFENHGTAAALQGMPHVAELGRLYGSTSDYRALTHPSLPNYLAMAGGSTFGVQDDKDPAAHPIESASVFDVALRRGQTAATYAEGMKTNCDQASYEGYAARHNPWTYFASPMSKAACARFDIPAGDLASGALHDAIAQGALPQVGLVVPDLCHDGHDCSLAQADAWLNPWIGEVMAGPDYSSGNLALVFTFDEDEGEGGGSSKILTIVVASRLAQQTVTTRLDHRSWTHWMTDLVGAPPLPGTSGSTSLGAAFHLCATPPGKSAC
ncbi:MAG: putative hydrolase [Frankiales bacterium]|nr:putative hydrolase [Frankiales bacterium]